jgi:hypothetical protein
MSYMTLVFKISDRIRNVNPVALHVVIGAVAGYFLLHPISMVIYWFEFNEVQLTFNQFLEVFFERLTHAFHPRMIIMALIFAAIGGFLGLGPGLFLKSIKQQQHELKGREKLLQKSIPILIKEGVGQYVEFKSSLRYDYRQAKSVKSIEDITISSIAGFLNSKGGMMLFGVDNEGNILGLSNDYWTLKKKNQDGFQQQVMNIVSSKLGRDQCSNIHITFHEVQSKEICSLTIESSNRPVYVSDGNRTVFYLRTGNVTNSLTTKETVEYLSLRQIN